MFLSPPPALAGRGRPADRCERPPASSGAQGEGWGRGARGQRPGSRPSVLNLRTRRAVARSRLEARACLPHPTWAKRRPPPASSLPPASQMDVLVSQSDTSRFPPQSAGPESDEGEIPDKPRLRDTLPSDRPGLFRSIEKDKKCEAQLQIRRGDCGRRKVYRRRTRLRQRTGSERVLSMALLLVKV